MIETVSGYSFQIADLKAGERLPGISAFMRIRNGADFLERTILSHAEFFDEIVVVFNQCTDDTPHILERMQQRIGPKLRVVHYTDRVFPPGSEGHASTSSVAPASMVNYSNFALATTSRRTVTKLDDDHLAIPGAVAQVVARLRANHGAQGRLFAFSGLNLFSRSDGGLGIPARDPFSGGGDIGFFDVTESTFFKHDRRFERAPGAQLARQFCGFLYWHLKYLKAGRGFANYELEQNPQSRFARRKAQFEANPEVSDLGKLKHSVRPGMLMRAKALFSKKTRMAFDRAVFLAEAFPENDVETALRRTADQVFLDGLI